MEIDRKLPNMIGLHGRYPAGSGTMEIDRKLLKTIENNGRQELSDEEKRKRDEEWREFLAEMRKRPPAKRRLRIYFRSPIVIEYRGDFD